MGTEKPSPARPVRDDAQSARQLAQARVREIVCVSEIVCVCVCVREREREREGRGTGRGRGRERESEKEAEIFNGQILG